MKMADHPQQNQQQQQTTQAQHQQQHSAQQQQTQQQQQAAVQQGSSQQQNVSASGGQSSNAMNTIVGGQSLTSTMAANAAAVAAAGIRNPIPQVQVIPQIHSPPYISQFPYNQQQQQIMLQNAAAMQAAMQASAMNMNPQQFNMNMNMAAMMQGRPQSVSGNMSSPANLMSPSPTTPTQQNPSVNFSSTATTQVTSSNTQSANGKVANGNKGQTTQGQTQQAQATALVGGKPIMPTQGMAAGGPPPLVLGQFSVLPNQLSGNSSGFVTAQSKGQAVSMAMSAAHSGQQQVISSQAPLRFTQPQLVSSTGQIFTSQPMLTNQAMLQAMANLQQQGIPLAHQPLLSATGQSPTILSGQQLFIRPANQIAPQQGMMTAGVQTIGTAMKQGSRVDMPQNLQVKPSAVGGISKQTAGAQAGKAILPQLPKTAMAKISPTHIGGQRPKLSIPSLPRKQNRGRPCNPNKAAAVTTATAATNTVASALSQAKANAASTSQSKPATPTNQAVNCQSKSQSDSEVEAIKKTSTTNGILESRPAEPRTKDTLPDVVNSTSDQIAPEIVSMDNPVLGNRDTPVVEKQRAIVKPHILTHVIEGFVIQEGPEPFPVERSSLLTEFIPPKPGQQMEGIQMAESSTMETEDNMSGEKKTDTKPRFDKCDFCGKEKQSKKFRRSNRFCSMPCARRFNVACSRRISLFKAKGRPPSISGGKVLKKKPLFALRKGWRARGRGGRLSYNSGQRNLPGDMDIDEEQYDPADNSSSPSSENESSTTPDSPVTVQGPGDLDTPPSNPARWNVLEVYEFIKSMQGCASYAEEFRSQEIDGQALMLLKEDHLMTAMNMKLGPALKICARINSLKDETV